MTRAKVFQFGLAVLLIGGVGYLGLSMAGFDGLTSGIISEAFLVIIVLVWTGSYFYRVLTGNMTFIEQRKRYREAYDELSKKKLQAKFDSLSEEEQIRLLKELEK